MAPSGSRLSSPMMSNASLLPTSTRSSLSSPGSASRNSSPKMSSSPYRNHPRLSIRAPKLHLTQPRSRSIGSLLATPFRLGRRRSMLLFLLSFTVIWLIWRSTSSVEGVTTRSCRLRPWQARCFGLVGRRAGNGASGAGETLNLALLHFEQKGGYLHYPGHRSQAVTMQEDDSEAQDSSSAKVGQDVVPPQPHPIHLLMDKARRAWDKKIKSQSRTLRDAVDEYVRRYGRRPPRGFEQWYYFARAHNYVLIDEFDSLSANVEPFLGLRPSKLRQRSNTIQHDEKFWMQDKTFTVELKELGRIVQSHGPMNWVNERPAQVLKLLGGLVKDLPDMNITITGHDNPWVVISSETRSKLVNAARAGQYLAVDEEDEVHEDWSYDGWATACPAGSPLRSAPNFDTRLAAQKDWVAPAPSFIEDHLATMDVCEHPERSLLHGFTSWSGPRPGLLYPLFTFTKTGLHADLLLPALEQYDRPVGRDPAWEDKKRERVVWRGTTTGADLNIKHMRDWSQRPRLCRLPYTPGNLTLTYAPNDQPGQLGPTEKFTARAEDLGLRYFDFRFLGEPQQCSDKDACEEFKRDFLWDKYMPEEEQNQYKYVMDVDGNGWSGRLHRLMSSNSLVLKSTIFPEWYADSIQPWLHYVPISTDYSDLWTTMAFFRGDEEGRGAHDELAKDIALAGKKWAETHWRWEDMQVYLYRLLLEYARIMHRSDDNPQSMDM